MDVFFFPGSTYTYLTVMRIDRMAKARNVELTWRPFNVREIMVEMDNIPFAKKPIKSRYMWRDIERRALRHGVVPYPAQPPYPVDPDLKALRVATVAASEGWCGDFAAASHRAWFVEGKAPGIGTATEEVVASLGQDVARVMANADSDEIKQRLGRETDAARELGVFGSPTFAIGAEIFWGDDRLEDALDWAVANPA
jgi:2-hydroxychromene-2-carboxylate isomerase